MKLIESCETRREIQNCVNIYLNCLSWSCDGQIMIKGRLDDSQVVAYTAPKFTKKLNFFEFKNLEIKLDPSPLIGTMPQFFFFKLSYFMASLSNILCTHDNLSVLTCVLSQSSNGFKICIHESVHTVFLGA